MSSQLLWELVKNHNKFLVKNNGNRFSSDPYNPTRRATLSSTGFISRNAVAITANKPNAEKTKNLTHFNLSFKKRQRFLNKSRDQPKTEKAVPAGFKLHCDREQLNVKRGVHRASKVIRKRYANKNTALMRLNLRRLFLLHKANGSKKVVIREKNRK